MLDIRESRLRETDGFLSNSILIDMLAQEPSMMFTVRRGGCEILTGGGKGKKGRDKEGTSVSERNK